MTRRMEISRAIRLDIHFVRVERKKKKGRKKEENIFYG